MSSPLALEQLAVPRTYELTTRSVMRMNDAVDQNTYYTTAQQTLLERKPNNTYRLAVEVISFRSDNSTFFHQFAADLNQVSNKLIIQTDLYGRLERIENKDEMVRTWRRIKPDLARKYRDYYKPAFFEAFEQNLMTEGVFEKTLRHKGLHGVLLPGFYGYGYSADAPITGHRVLEQFINHVDLPLCTITTRTSEDITSPYLELQVTGSLNDKAFRDDDLRRLFRTMADNPLLKVNLTATSHETYTVEAATGWLQKATQHLVVEVPGIYHNEVRYDLRTIE